MASNAHLYVNKPLVLPQVVAAGSGTAVVYSCKCGDERPHNEDCSAIFPIDNQSGVLAVADGAGGMRGADQASGIAIESLHTAIENRSEDDATLRTAILNGFENANREILELGIGAATTLSVVEIQDDTARPYHVGDSDIMVVGQRGRIKMKTVPHSPVGYAVESGMLDRRSAINHEDRHLVSNLIGAADMHIQVGAPVRLSRFDTVVVASDGLADNLLRDEIVDIIRKGPLELAANALAQLALDRMLKPKPNLPSKPDDLTFILFRLAAPIG